MRWFSFLILVQVILSSMLAVATPVKKIGSCKASQMELRLAGVELKEGLRSLPKARYIAKRADFFVLDKDQKVVLQSRQSFLNKRSELICAELSSQANGSYSVYAPVLLNLQEGFVAESTWQFQITQDKSRVGVWNQMSRLGKFVLDAEKQDQQFIVVEVNRSTYDLILLKNESTATLLIKVRFDRI